MFRRLISAFLVALFPSVALAMDYPINLSVLQGWQQKDGSLVAGIRMDLDEGWKTYWRAPGEGGIPPIFDFNRSTNLAGFSVIWPTPEVFDQDGLQSIGYSDFVILPLVLRRDVTDRDIKLRGTVSLGVCKDVCIPVEMRINASLEADNAQRNPALTAAMISVPLTASEAGVTRTTCKMTPSEDGMTLTTTITMPTSGAQEYTVVESADPDHWLTETENRRVGDSLISTSFLASMTGQTLMVNRSDLRFTVIGSDYAVDIQGCSGS